MWLNCKRSNRCSGLDLGLLSDANFEVKGDPFVSERLLTLILSGHNRRLTLLSLPVGTPQPSTFRSGPQGPFKLAHTPVITRLVRSIRLFIDSLPPMACTSIRRPSKVLVQITIKLGLPPLHFLHTTPGFESRPL